VPARLAAARRAPLARRRTARKANPSAAVALRRVKRCHVLLGHVQATATATRTYRCLMQSGVALEGSLMTTVA